ncbi:MAG: hypothetical protein IPK83_01685 [Planctomycetes bacterium]|nr:hypothetical protein [Planctomycetota bacterium]
MSRNSKSIMILIVSVLFGADSILAGSKSAPDRAASSVEVIGSATDGTGLMDYFFETPLNSARTRILPDRSDRKDIRRHRCGESHGQPFRIDHSL